jgi:hypothetical protein
MEFGEAIVVAGCALAFLCVTIFLHAMLARWTRRHSDENAADWPSSLTAALGLATAASMLLVFYLDISLTATPGILDRGTKDSAVAVAYAVLLLSTVACLFFFAPFAYCSISSGITTDFDDGDLSARARCCRRFAGGIKAMLFTVLLLAATLLAGIVLKLDSDTSFPFQRPNLSPIESGVMFLVALLIAAGLIVLILCTVSI